MGTSQIRLDVHELGIGMQVQVPKNLDKNLVGSRVVKSVLDWEHKHGVHLNPGKAPALPPDEMASLVNFLFQILMLDSIFQQFL